LRPSESVLRDKVGLRQGTALAVPHGKEIRHFHLVRRTRRRSSRSTPHAPPRPPQNREESVERSCSAGQQSGSLCFSPFQILSFCRSFDNRLWVISTPQPIFVLANSFPHRPDGELTRTQNNYVSGTGALPIRAIRNYFMVTCLRGESIHLAACGPFVVRVSRARTGEWREQPRAGNQAGPINQYSAGRTQSRGRSIFRRTGCFRIHPSRPAL
jgi:hypothetical protein